MTEKKTGIPGELTNAGELRNMIDHAQALYENNDFKSAIDLLDQVILADPHSAEAYNNRGLVKTSMKHYEDAIDDLTMALSLSPEFVMPYLNRGIAYFDSNEFPKAIEDF